MGCRCSMKTSPDCQKQLFSTTDPHSNFTQLAIKMVKYFQRKISLSAKEYKQEVTTKGPFPIAILTRVCFARLSWKNLLGPIVPPVTVTLKRKYQANSDTSRVEKACANSGKMAKEQGREKAPVSLAALVLFQVGIFQGRGKADPKGCPREIKYFSKAYSLCFSFSLNRRIPI